MKPLPKSTPPSVVERVENLSAEITRLKAERDALLAGLLVPSHEKPGRLGFARHVYAEGQHGEEFLPFLDGARVSFREHVGDDRSAIEIVDGTDETYPKRPALIVRGIGRSAGTLLVTPRAANVIYVELDAR